MEDLDAWEDPEPLWTPNASPDSSPDKDFLPQAPKPSQSAPGSKVAGTQDLSPRSVRALDLAADGKSDSEDELLPSGSMPSAGASPMPQAGTRFSFSQPLALRETNLLALPPAASSQPATELGGEEEAPKAKKAHRKDPALVEAERRAKDEAREAKKRARDEAKAAKEAEAERKRKAKDAAKESRAREGLDSCERFVDTLVSPDVLQRFPDLHRHLDAAYDADGGVAWRRDAGAPLPSVQFRRRLLDPETGEESEELAQHSLLVLPLDLLLRADKAPDEVLQWLKGARDGVAGGRSVTAVAVAFGEEVKERGGRKPRVEAQMALRARAQLEARVQWREATTVADFAELCRGFHKSVGQELVKRSRKASLQHLSRDGVRKGCDVKERPDAPTLRANLQKLLVELPGVREACAEELAQRFGSFRALAKATQRPGAAEALAAVSIRRGDVERQVGPALAAALVAYFSPHSGPSDAFKAS